MSGSIKYICSIVHSEFWTEAVLGEYDDDQETLAYIECRSTSNCSLFFSVYFSVANSITSSGVPSNPAIILCSNRQ